MYLHSSQTRTIGELYIGGLQDVVRIAGTANFPILRFITEPHWGSVPFASLDNILPLLVSIVIVYHGTVIYILYILYI